VAFPASPPVTRLGWCHHGRPAERDRIALPGLGRAGLTADEVGLFEINEAFAAMCVATVRLLGLDLDRVNVNGSGCSLGHPVAATGARMLVTLVHELRRRGGGVGVAAMCAGGGMGSAVVIEVPA
jgi:acetyl-CoA acyltransferase